MQPVADNPVEVVRHLQAVDHEHNRGQGLTPQVTSSYFSLE